MTPEEIQSFLKVVAEDFKAPRTPILHNPKEANLEYEDVFFPAEDGITIEGWFIPRKGSNKVIIANHPLRFTRAGYPSHISPFNQFCGGSATGNDFEINFIPDYKILHDAGYNVLTYDLRNCGHSASAHGGISTGGIYESRDVVGSLNYIRQRQDTKHMTIGLFSRCMGATSTWWAMKRRPDVFEGVRCMLAPQPVSPQAIMTKMLTSMGIGLEYMDELNKQLQLVISFKIEDLLVHDLVPYVRTPTFLYQVREDVLTTPDDVQKMYDLLPMEDKKLHWIEGTSARWKGYTYFQENPGQFLEWLSAHMA